MPSNVDNPNGFQYMSLFHGEPPVTLEYEKQSSMATAIFENDVVHAIAGVAGFSKPPVEAFGTGTPGTTIPLGISLNYGAASTRTRQTVIVDPNAFFHAQDDGDTDGIADSSMGLNANVSVGAGSTLTRASGHEIDEAAIATSSALDLHMIGLYPDPNNVSGTAHLRIIVRFNKHRFAWGVAGV